MNLESLINDANNYYVDEDIAVIYKKPTPIGLVDVDYKSGIIKKEKLDDMELTSGINENDEDNEDKEELLTQTSKEDE